MPSNVNNADVSTVENVNTTVTTALRQTDGTTSNGNVVTTFSTTGTGDALVTRLTTSDSGYPPNDTATCAELIEYAKDMKDHWTRVGEVLADYVASQQ